MADTLPPPPFERPKEVARLRAHKATSFDETPTEAEAEAVRKALGLRGLRKMRFQGKLSPIGKRGWLVEGSLGASITQDCVVTVEPIKTRIDTEVRLRFLPETMIETETPEDELEDDVEELGPVIDLGHVAVEALSLAMPDYPRADGAGLKTLTAQPEGEAPIKDEDTKAFAGLAALKAKMDQNPEN